MDYGTPRVSFGLVIVLTVPSEKLKLYCSCHFTVFSYRSLEVNCLALGNREALVYTKIKWVAASIASLFLLSVVRFFLYLEDDEI